MEDYDDWDLCPENAHPRARQVLDQSFYWDCTDENSPLGNDTGADTLAFYQKRRQENPGEDPEWFLDDLSAAWDVEAENWELVDPGLIRQELERNEHCLLIMDGMIIGLAFAQLVMNGSIDPEVRRLALLAIERQSTDTLIEFRGWVDAAERKERLTHMHGILERG